MSRKPKKGYWVRGEFVAEGSELDLQLKAELKGDTSRTDLKRESEELQKLGEQLLTLREELFARLALPEKLVEALDDLKRITNFEGRRRQSQYVGKLMRNLGQEEVQSIRGALDEQDKGSARDAMALHEAEQWRDDLITKDDALETWIARYPGTDTQQLRALIRQARKETPHDADAVSKGLAPRHGRAYRDIFQLVKTQLQEAQGDGDE
ncbi:MAG TPA: ribosome biogenesis factor YjgA [Ramlibacter sp.]|nr:ribosome biogenesis factor YjgA [Ramlibacter sp.]